MTISKITIAVLALASGFAGISQAQAGQGSFMLGHSAFETRCDANGGSFSPDGVEFACQLDGIKIACLFDGADSFCDWNAAQNQHDVRRVLGVALAESLSDGHEGRDIAGKTLVQTPGGGGAILVPPKKKP